MPRQDKPSGSLPATDDGPIRRKRRKASKSAGKATGAPPKDRPDRPARAGGGFLSSFLPRGYMTKGGTITTSGGSGGGGSISADLNAIPLLSEMFKSGGPVKARKGRAKR